MKDDGGLEQQTITIREFKKVRIVEKIKYPDGTEKSKATEFFVDSKKTPSWNGTVARIILAGILVGAAVYTGQLEVLLKLLL